MNRAIGGIGVGPPAIILPRPVSMRPNGIVEVVWIRPDDQHTFHHEISPPAPRTPGRSRDV